MTACRRPTVYPAMLLLGLFVAVATSWNVTTIDGRKFAWFVSLGTWTILGLGLLQLLQGLALWNTARSQLKRLAHTPIEQHLHEAAPQVRS